MVLADQLFIISGNHVKLSAFLSGMSNYFAFLVQLFLQFGDSVDIETNFNFMNIHSAILAIGGLN